MEDIATVYCSTITKTWNNLNIHQWMNVYNEILVFVSCPLLKQNIPEALDFRRTEAYLSYGLGGPRSSLGLVVPGMFSVVKVLGGNDRGFIKIGS